MTSLESAMYVDESAAFTGDKTHPHFLSNRMFMSFKSLEEYGKRTMSSLIREA